MLLKSVKLSVKDSVKAIGFAVMVAAGIAIPLPVSAQSGIIPVVLRSPEGPSLTQPSESGCCDAPCIDTEPEERHVRGWVSAEFLRWWIRPGPSPALVSTGPAGTPIASAGVLGQPGTQVVFPSPDLDYGASSGARVTAVLLPSEDKLFGVETSFFFLGRKSTGFDGASDAAGTPIIARPVFNAALGSEAAGIVAVPGSLSGDLAISASSRLWGAEFNLTEPLVDGRYPVRFILGFLFLRWDESLGITQDSTVLAQGVAGFNGTTLAPGNRLIVADGFDTRTQFYGGQAGIAGDWGFRRLRMDWAIKVGVGESNELANIHGSTTLIPAGGGADQTAAGGLLALPSNIGRYTDERYSFTTIG